MYDLMGRFLPAGWGDLLFMKRALLALLLLAPACAAAGVHVVSFRLAFFSDAISHSALAGVAIGLVAGLDPRLTVALFGLLVGLAIISARRYTGAATDTAVGVTMAGVMALGITIISARKGLAGPMHAFLYGDVLAAGDFEIAMAMAVFAVTMAFTAIAYNRLLFVSLDENLARSRGIRAAAYEYACAAVVALVVCFGVMAVGLLLATALLVVPAATGRNLARTAGGAFWWSVVAALISSVAGLAASVEWGSATGATIVLFAVAIFLVSAAFARLRGSGSGKRDVRPRS
jgi:zinc transport system permease protein